MKHAPSMRQRLLLAGGVGLLVLVALSSLLLGMLFERAVRERLDRELERDTLNVIAQLEVNVDGQPQLQAMPGDGRYQRVFSGNYWQLSNDAGDPILQSRSLWDQTLPVRPSAGTAPDRPEHYDLTGPLNQPLRARMQQLRLPRAAAPMTLLVASDRSALDAEVVRFRWYVASAITLLAAVWLLTLISQVSFALRPLHTLGRRVERIRRGESERIDTDDLSGDIAPLATELNTLLDHHQRMVQRARTSAQDLAHALKTPLAVLAAETAGDGQHWRDTIHQQGQRMQASVDRYLASGLATHAQQRCELMPVASALLPLMQRLHGSRNVQFHNQINDPALQFGGERADLEEMLGNLLDNAGKWASANVWLQARRDGEVLRIEISDDGPGLPETALETVLQRGVRLDERAQSTGLGLAIVSDIAVSYGGELRLSNRQPGLHAALSLPAR
jgi:signal transduction histidine kinase